MNANDQAQKGFKTFILTLSISLIVFSVIYYLISNNSSFEDSVPTQAVQSGDVSGEEQSQKAEDAKVAAEPNQPQAQAMNIKEEVARAQDQGDVSGVSSVKAETKPVVNTVTVETKDAGSNAGSVFGQLASGGSVLAGASESSQSTVPSTGTMGITIGLVSSLLIFLGVMVFVSNDPRRLAMLSFEKRVIKEVDRK